MEREMIKSFEEIIKNAHTRYFKVRVNGKITYKRLFYNSLYGICEYKRNNRNFGIEVPYSELETWESVEVKTINNFVKVKNFLTNVVRYLDKSGLWSDIKADFQLMLNLGDDFIKLVFESSYEERNKLFNEYGMTSSWDSLLDTALKGIKAINYDKYEKDTIREHFADAIKNKRKFNYSWTKGYDNTIGCYQGRDDNMCALYSEEYRGCGNGHYYLALDERHAIFYEND